MKGTLFNTATVVTGSLLGLVIGKNVPGSFQTVALHGLGLVTLLAGIGMGLKGKDFVLVAASVALGGILGLAMGISQGIEAFAAWAKSVVGGGGRFSEGFVTAYILFCVGPMTLLGCIEDGLEGESRLLRLKGTLDGIASVFLAAAMGVGVLFVAPVLFLTQAVLTVMARRLKRATEAPETLDAIQGVGGAILLTTAFGLLDIAKLRGETYLPALVLAPALVTLKARWANRAASSM